MKITNRAKRSWSLVCGVACVAALAALAACGKKDGPAAEIVPEVTVIQPSSEPVTDYLTFTGNAEASESVQLQARVSGFLTKVAFKDGDFVKKSDLLFEIEREPYEAKLALAEAAIASAQAELLRAQLELDRQEGLVKQRAVAVADVEKARASRDTAAAKLNQAKSEKDLADINLGYTRIYAPFDGRVDRSLKDPGNLVGAGEATLLTTIYKMDPVYAYFSINEKDLVKVRSNGQSSVEKVIEGGIEGDEGYPEKGVIDFGSSALDSTTGTLLLRGVFKNPPLAMMPKIIPGMFMRLRVPIKQRDKAVLVPDRALGVDQSGRFVLVVGDGDVVDKKSVKAGAQVRDLRVIEEGLSGNERVIVAGLQQARPGTKVKPVIQGAAEKAAAAEGAKK